MNEAFNNPEWIAERKHWDELTRKYRIYCMQSPSDEIWVGDTERIIKCLMNNKQETEEQIIKRIEESTMDNPITARDECFWIEPDEVK